MPLYFAYGLNMDRAAMAQRCPNSRPLGLARLPRHRFIVSRDGYATVVRDPRETVHGLLWDCSLGDIRVLDKFEDIASGLYVKINQPVIVPGGAKRALIYIGRSGDVGSAKPGYLEQVIAAARDCDLPDAYIASMTRFLNRPAASFGTMVTAAAEEVPAAGPVSGVRPRAVAPR